MSAIDLNDAIRNLVEAEVHRVLDPYRFVLDRLSAFAGAAPAQRSVGRPPRGAGRPARRGGRRAVSRGGNGDASKFQEGQSVKYQQGRGVFVAKVVKIDADANRVMLERERDGKKLSRPASRVYPA
jgi:hypothetical protein